MQIVNISIKSVFALVLLTPSAWAYVDGVELLEKDNKHILIIGDRHIEREGIAKSLLKKEGDDIAITTHFITNLFKSKIASNWVLESPSTPDENVPADAIKLELLYAIPEKIRKVDRLPSSIINGIFSDFRRDEIKEIFIGSHGIVAMMMNEGFAMLDALDAWTPKDEIWKRSSANGISPDEGAEKLEDYWRSNRKFSSAMESMIDKVSMMLEEVQRSQFGRATTFSVFEEKFSTLQSQLESAGLDDAPLVACNTELETLRRSLNASKQASFARFVFGEMKQKRSFNPLSQVTPNFS